MISRHALPPLAPLLLASLLAACGQARPQPIPAVAEQRQCPAYPLPPEALLKPPVTTDFLTSAALTATEQAIQLDELIAWVRKQAAVDPNKARANLCILNPVRCVEGVEHKGGDECRQLNRSAST